MSIQKEVKSNLCLVPQLSAIDIKDVLVRVDKYDLRTIQWPGHRDSYCAVRHEIVQH
jgi:hypothetical protein